MSLARRLALTIARNSIRLVLFAFVSLLALHLTFKDAQIVNDALEDTNAYSKFVPNIVEANAKQSPNSLFTDPNVQKLFNDAFPASFIEAQSDMFVSAMFSWLQGQTMQPEFSITIQEQRSRLAEALSIYGIERVAGLPTCTAFETVVQLDPFQATCQPSGLNYKNEQVALQQSLLDSPSFLAKTSYTADDLPKDKTGRSFSEAYMSVPTLYQATPYILFALGAVLVLLSTILVSLRPLKRNGWRDLGKATLYSSLVLAVTAGIFGIFVPRLVRQQQSNFITNGTEALITEIVTAISVDFQVTFIVIALCFTSLALGILLLVKLVPKGSRYKSLEHVTGIANAIAPVKRTFTKSVGNIPVVTSEKQKKRTKSSTLNKKTNRIKREIV